MNTRLRGRRLTASMILLTCCSLAPLSAQGEPPKLASLKLGDSPYEMARPALWLQGPVEGDSVVSSWVESDRYLYPLMSVTLEPLPAPGEAGVERLLASLPQSFPGYRELQGTWVEIGGIRAHRSVSVWSSIFGQLKAARLLIPWKEKVFVVTFADQESTFARNAELYDFCINALAPFESLEVRDKKPGSS